MGKKTRRKTHTPERGPAPAALLRAPPRTTPIGRITHLAESLESRLYLSATPFHSPSGEPVSNVVLIDSNLMDESILQSAVCSGCKVFVYDGTSASPQSVLTGVVAWARSQHVLIGSLSILDHGQSGEFLLGNTWISRRSLSATSAAWQTLGEVLSPRAVVDLYGCDVAAPGGGGQSLINQLAQLTGATVFASSHLVGYGGTWNLDAESAAHCVSFEPDTSRIFSLPQLDAYPGTLYTLSVATAAAVSASPVTATSVNLSVLGATTNPAGESSLIYTWSVSPTTYTVTYGSNGTNAAKNTTVTFSHAYTSYVFKCTISDSSGSTAVTSSVTVAVNQTFSSIKFTGTTSSINENGTKTITAKGYDQFGIVMSTEPTWTWSIESGAGTLSVVNSTQDKYTPSNSAGTMVIECASGSISSTFDVTVNEVPPTVSTAAKITPSPVTGTTGALSVLGASDGGAANLTYTWAATTEPAGANPVFSANGTNAAKASTVTFNKAGSYTFKATISDGQGGTVTSSVTCTVNQTLASIVVSPATAKLYESSTQQFSATGYDQFGNVMTTQPTLTWSVVTGGAGGTVNSSGLYTAPAALGTTTVKATSGSVSGTASVTISNTSAAASASPATVTGSTTSLSVLGTGDTGQANYTYTWATTGSPPAPVNFSINGTNGAKNTTATFAIAGTYNIQVTLNNNGTISTSSVTVTVNQTLTSISVSPSTAALSLNQTQTLSASALDQFGNAMASQPSFSWTMDNGSVGSFNTSTLLYTAATTPGTATVRATASGVSGSSVLIVTESPPTITTTAAAANPAPVTGTSTTLSVAASSAGGAANLLYTWSTTGTPPAPVTFSDNADNTAQSTTATFTVAGTYNFLVTVSDESNNSVTSSVTVVVNQTLTSITVTPSSASVNAAGTQAFSASGYDQFGNTMVTQPTFTWSADIGTIDQSGNYAAPLVSATPTITASSAGVSGTATVTVTDQPPTIATAATASPTTVAGTTTSLFVLGADDGGESNLTYSWATTGSPPAPVTFSANSSNAAKNTTATFTAAGTYDFLVTITDTGGLTATSSTSVTVDQTLTSIALSPTSASLNENQTQPFTATGYDQFNNALTSQPSFSWSKITGIGSVSSSGLYTSPGAAGTATVQASSAGINATASITITDSPPLIVNPAVASPSTVTGTTTALSVLGDSDVGAGNLTYTWTASTKPNGANPTFSANGSNAAQNSTVTFNEAGNYIFTATISDGQGQSVTSSVNVTVDQTLTSITVSPETSSLYENQSEQLIATGYDQFNNALLSQPTFTWTANGGSVDSNGNYTAPGAGDAGTYTLTATSGSISGNATVNVSDAAPTVTTPASASPSPVTGKTTNLSVLGASDQGEGDLTYTWVAIGSSPSGVTFSDNGDNSAQDSIATFTQAGDYTFQVTITDLEGLSVISSVNVTVDQTLTSIVVSPPISPVNENQSEQLTATGLDQFHNALLSQPTFTWTANGGSVDSSGKFTAPGAGDAGIYTVTATSGSITGNATVNVSDAAPTVTTPASASPSPVSGKTTTLSVLGASDQGESNLTYTWVAVGSSPSGVTFDENADNSAKETVATFTQSGDYSFQVTITDEEGLSVTSSVNVSVDQTLTSITVSSPSSSLNENQSESLIATGYDQFGNSLTSQPTFSWTTNGGSVDANGNYTAPGANDAGIYTITATSESISGNATVNVSDAAPTVTTPASATPSPVTGKTTQLSVLGNSDQGQADLTYTWAAIGTSPSGVTFTDNGDNVAQNNTATFTQAGDYSFQVTITDEDGLSVTSSVNVSVDQTLTSITVSPPSSSLNENQSESLIATGYDQFGNSLTSQPTFSWTTNGGSVDANGNYTAPGANDAGIYTITATNESISGNATVNVSDAAPTVTTPASASPSPVSGKTTTLSVLGASDQGESNLTYTWAAVGTSPSGVTFDDNADNSAKETVATFTQSGDYSFQVTITDEEGLSVTSSVNVTVEQTLTSITIAPATSSLYENQSEQLIATGYDQFNSVLLPQPAFTWTANGGSVDSSGNYTAPGANDAGTYTVTATSGSISGNATVNVSDSAPTVTTPASASPSPVTGKTTAMSVLGASDQGEGDLTYTWAAVGSSPSGVTFSDNGDNSAQDSIATFTQAGEYTFQVTITDLEGLSITDSVNVTVEQTLSGISIQPIQGSVGIGQVIQLTAQGVDQFGSEMPTGVVTWAATSGNGTVSSNGTFTAPAVTERDTLTASAGGFLATTSITVSDGSSIVAGQSPVRGTSTSLSLTGIAGSGLTYLWQTISAPSGALMPTFSNNDSTAAGTTQITFSAAGEYEIGVTISDGSTSTLDTIEIQVVQTPTAISVSPATSMIRLNDSEALSATVLDQFGQAITNAPAVQWSVTGGVGNVSSSGLFTSGTTSGTAQVQAALSGIIGTASVVVTNAPPTVATAALAAFTNRSNSAVSLSVLGADDGGETGLTYTWSVRSAPAGATVGFATNGTNASKNTVATLNSVGLYWFACTISDGTSTVTSQVSIQAEQVLSQLVLTPPTAVISAGGFRQFAATGLDQFGQPMATLPPVAWAVTSGPGTIDPASGLYQAIGGAGATIVQAAVDGTVGTARLRIVATAPSGNNFSSTPVATPALIEAITVTPLDAISPGTASAAVGAPATTPSAVGNPATTIANSLPSDSVSAGSPYPDRANSSVPTGDVNGAAHSVTEVAPVNGLPTKGADNTGISGTADANPTPVPPSQPRTNGNKNAATVGNRANVFADIPLTQGATNSADHSVATIGATPLNAQPQSPTPTATPSHFWQNDRPLTNFAWTTGGAALLGYALTSLKIAGGGLSAPIAPTKPETSIPSSNRSVRNGSPKKP